MRRHAGEAFDDGVITGLRADAFPLDLRRGPEVSLGSHFCGTKRRP